MQDREQGYIPRVKPRFRWNRILTVIGLILSPFILHWLTTNIDLGDFRSLPIIRSCSNVYETKCLIVLCLVLLSVVLMVKLMRGK